MFEVGKKYRRTQISKRNQERINFYECVAVGEIQAFFKQIDFEGKTINEVAIPNDIANRFEVLGDTEEKNLFLNQLIFKKEKELMYLQKEKEAVLKKEIKVINELKDLKTRLDGNPRNHITWESAVDNSFGFNRKDNSLWL